MRVRGLFLALVVLVLGSCVAKARADGADSILVERYVYRAALIGRWPVQIFYRRGGGVEDLHAQDEWPSVPPGRTVTLLEAEAWLRWPDGSVSPRAPAT